MVEHALIGEQRRIHDSYPDAFAVIHNHLDKEIEAANIIGAPGGGGVTLNRQAKSAARSAFESTKQRLFGHLLAGIKTVTLIHSIEADLAAGHAAVVQIVSTGDALTDRQLAEIPTSFRPLSATASSNRQTKSVR